MKGTMSTDTYTAPELHLELDDMSGTGKIVQHLLNLREQAGDNDSDYCTTLAHLTREVLAAQKNLLDRLKAERP